MFLGYTEEQTQHTFSTCGHTEAALARDAYFAMAKSMRPAGPGKAGKMALYSCCYRCFVPQAMCDKWQRQEGERGRWRATNNSCQFDDIILPVIVCMFREGSDEGRGLFQEWVTKSGVCETDREEVLRWFGQKVIWGGVEGSRLCQVFWEFSNMVNKDGVQGVFREGV